jgi:hypothetical protein
MSHHGQLVLTICDIKSLKTTTLQKHNYLYEISYRVVGCLFLILGSKNRVIRDDFTLIT